MKKCHRCGTAWRGYGKEPRSREVCEGCGGYLHCCDNCQHFDHKVSISCKLTTTAYVGPRQQLNYCEEFAMHDTHVEAKKNKVNNARSRWEALFSD